MGRGEAEMVLGQVRDDVLARNIGSSDDDELIPGDGRIVRDRGNASARNQNCARSLRRTTYPAGVNVVDIFCLPIDLGDTLLTQRRELPTVRRD